MIKNLRCDKDIILEKDKRMFSRKILLLTLLATSCSSLFAQGLILNDQNLRTDLNWLNQQGVIRLSTSTWPLSGGEVQRSIDQAKVSTLAQQRVLDSVKQRLNIENEQLKASLSAATDQKTIPQGFGDSQKSKYQGSVQFNASSEHWATKIQANLEQDQRLDEGDKFNLDGSYVAGHFANQWVAFAKMPTWWGPGNDGSLIRGDANRPVTGFTAQRNIQNAFENKWLSWIGPWQYQVFAGQLQDYDAVSRAQLLGLRLTAQPLPYLELGASRSIQIGGKGQPKSFKAYWNAIIGKDNGDADTGYVGENNASNQLAGFDGRLNLQPLLNIPVSIYGQYIGEDEAGGLPSRSMYLAGADFSSSYKNLPYQIYTEWADTRTNGDAIGYSYNHHQYKDGYYQQGYPLGHGIGGDGQLYSVGGKIQFDRINQLKGRVLYAKVNESNRLTNELFPQADTIKAVDVTWVHYLKPQIPLKINAWAAKSDKQSNDSGASVGIEFPIDFK